MTLQEAAQGAAGRMRGVPIRVRVLLMITAVSTLTLIIAVSAIFSYEQVTAKDSELEHTSVKAALIAANLTPALLFSDSLAAAKILKNIDADPAMLSAEVRLPDGTIFASHGRLEEKSAAAVNSKKFRFQSHTIYLNSKPIGELKLQVSLESLKARQSTTVSVVVGVFCISFILSIILALAFQGVILKPVMAMLQHLQLIEAAGNYGLRLKMERYDELGDLANGIDQMVAKVQERDTALQRHGEQLQKLVEVRTQQLNQKAYFDSLTGLANRDLLNDRLQQAIGNCYRENSELAVLFLDLDRFKVVNDSLGHRVGDKLLRILGRRLTQLGRSGDTIARLGGDEFVFVMHNVANAEDAARGAQRIIQAFAQPFDIDGHLIHCSTSIGIALYPHDGQGADELLKSADLAMYQAKENGRDCFSFFTDELNERSQRRLQLEMAVRKAVDQEEFFLVYQPKVDLRTRRICGFEALIRSDNELLKQVGPEAFMGAADELGLTHQIGKLVFREVFRQMAEWSANGLSDVDVAVNVTANQLLGPGLQEAISTSAALYNMPCERLEIEIVENAFLEHSTQVVEVLKALRESGINIAIDDFGTGYSSMQYLQQFPVDTLKIDRMFIRDLVEGTSSAGIVSSVITLAHNLGLDIVAEGVETKEQLQYLLGQSCDIVQGYYFSKPLHTTEITFESLERIVHLSELEVQAAAA